MKFKNVSIDVDYVEMANDLRKLILDTISLRKKHKIVSIISALVAVCLCDLYTYINIPNCPWWALMLNSAALGGASYVGSMLHQKRMLFTIITDSYGRGCWEITKRKEVYEYALNHPIIDTPNTALSYIGNLPYRDRFIQDWYFWKNITECEFYMGHDNSTLLLKIGDRRTLWDIDAPIEYEITKDNINMHKVSLTDGKLTIVPIT